MSKYITRRQKGHTKLVSGKAFAWFQKSGHIIPMFNVHAMELTTF